MTASAAAGWQPIADLSESATAYGPDLAVDREGTTTAVWNRSNAVVTAQRGATGSWSAAEELAAAGSMPQVALAPDGTAVAVWAQRSTDYEIWSASRGLNGDWSPPQLLSSTDASKQAPSPAVVIDRAGNATVLWLQNCSVFSARRAFNGTWSAPVEVWTDPTPAELSTSCTLYQLQAGISGDTLARPLLDAGVDAAGDVTAVWRSGKRSSTEKTIRSSVRPAGGSSSWAAAKVVASAAGAHAPQLAVWADGRAVIGWGVNGGGARLSARPAGTDAAWGTPAPLSAAGTPEPAVAYDAHGNATVAWAQPAGDEDPASLWTATLDGAGNLGAPALGAAVEPDAITTDPRLAVADDGDLTLAWTRDEGGLDRVVQTAQRTDGTWEAVVTHAKETSADTLAVSPALAGDALGNAALAWVGEGVEDFGAADVLRTAAYAATPPLLVAWTANGLAGGSNLHSWLDYLVNGGGTVVAVDGASKADPNDRYSYRLAVADAWIERPGSETVIALKGTIGFSYPAHFINTRIVDPTIRIGAAGSARLIASGQGSGDMADAIGGNPKVEPFTGLHLLDLTLPAPLLSGDGTTRSWIAAAAKIVPGAAPGILAYAAGTPYGFFTFSIPADLPTRDAPQPPADRVAPPVAPPPAAALAPETKIRKARIVQRSRQATFRFGADQAGSSFLCSLDRKPFRACRSPQTYRNLTPGKHRFRVKAVVGGITDRSAAVRRFQIKPPRA